VKKLHHSGRAGPAPIVAKAEAWPPRRLAGRATAVLFVAGAFMSVICLALPRSPGGDTGGILLVGLSAAVMALISWFLPWDRWPRWVGLSRVLAGFGMLAMLNVVGGDDPYLYAIFFLAGFVWIGVVNPPLTALKLMPLFAAAYLLPLLVWSGQVALAAQSAVYVGILCLLVAEVPAWLVARWRRSQVALHEAYEAIDDMSAQLGTGGSAAALWQASAGRLCQLLDVPNCDIFRVAGDEDFVCIGSMLDGRPYPEYLGTRGGEMLWAIDYEALQSRAPVLVSTPEDPRLSAADRAEMLAWHEKALLTVPLVVGDQVIGIVEIGETRDGRTISPRQAATAASVCRLIALSVHDAEVIEDQKLHARRLASLLESSRAVVTTGQLDEALATVARGAAEALNAPECVIYEFDAPRDVIVARALYEVRPSGWDKLGVPVPLADHPVERALLLSGGVLEEVLSDTTIDASSRAAMEAWGEKTCLCVPLRYGEESKGLLLVYETERERHFTEDEVALANCLGEHAAAAIHNAQLIRRLEDRNRRLASLVDAGRAMTSSMDVADVLQQVSRHATGALRAYSSVIREYVKETETVIERAWYCVDPDDTYEVKQWSLADEDPVSKAILENGVIVEECVSDPSLSEESRRSMERWGEKTCLSVPLIFNDEPVGILLVTEVKEERHFGEEERELAAALGKQAAAAIHNAKLLEHLRSRNRELAEQTRQLAVVNEAGAEISATLDLQGVLRAVAGRLCAALDVPDCDILTLDEGAGVVCVANVVDGEVNEGLVGRSFGLEEWKPLRMALDTRSSLVFGAGDPRLGQLANAAMRLHGQTMVLAVPLIAGGSVIGVAELYERRAERVFRVDEIELAESICRAAALAVRNAELHGSLSERTRSLSGLLEATLAVSASVVLEEVLDQVARSAGKMLGSPECVIWEYDPALETIVERAIICEDPEYVSVEAVPLRDRPSEAFLLFGGQTVVESLSDPDIHPASRASMEECGKKTCLTVPLRFGEEPMGLLVVLETAAERQFSAAEIGALEALGRQAAVAIHNARQYRRQEEYTRRVTSLLEVGRAITAVGTPDDLLPIIASKVAEALGSPECIIFDYDPVADTLTAEALFQEKPSTYEDLGKPFALGDSPANRAVLEGRTITFETLSDQDLDPAVRESMEKWDERTCVNVPLYFGDEPLGILVLIETERERVFTQDEIELLRGLSEQAAIALHNARQFERLRLRSLESEVLNDIARAVSGSLNVPDVAAAVIAKLRRLTVFAQASLLLVEDDGKLRVAFTTERRSHIDGVSLADLDPEFMATLRHDRVAVIDSEGGGEPLRSGRSVLDGLRSAAIVGLYEDDQIIGALALGSRTEDAFSESVRRVLEGVSAHLSLAIKNARLFDSVKRLHLGNLKALSSALIAKDHYTIGHSARVAAYAILLAKEVGWSQSAIQEVEEVAYLHDIGKIAVSDSILLKPGALTEEQWEQMREHPVVSAEIVEPILPDRLVAGIRHHHERYDGRGYPDGLIGEDIPEMARLLCVVDCYDAMSSRRIYQQALTYSDCVAELERCRGEQFDAGMADAFVRVLRRMEEKTELAGVVAAEAAAKIDPRKHIALREPRDDAGADYADILAVLQDVRRVHPEVQALATESAVDAQRRMIIVDSDDDPVTRVRLGEVAPAEDQEVEVFSGRVPAANVIFVDTRGTWVSGVAPLRDASGAVVGLVRASMSPTDTCEVPAERSDAAASFAALARSAADRLTRAEIDARTDALTGLYNHRYLQQRLDEEIRGVIDGRGELSVLFCDIDHFKELNDQFGHAAGDEVLRKTAALVSCSIRRRDLAARYGGDEFVVAMAGIGTEKALEVAERLRSTVETAHIHPGGQPLTISVGIATFPRHVRDKEELMETADRAMYAAKQRGRNRCVCLAVGGTLTLGPRPCAPAHHERGRRAATR